MSSSSSSSTTATAPKRKGTWGDTPQKAAKLPKIGTEGNMPSEIYDLIEEIDGVRSREGTEAKLAAFSLALLALAKACGLSSAMRKKSVLREYRLNQQIIAGFGINEVKLGFAGTAGAAGESAQKGAKKRGTKGKSTDPLSEAERDALKEQHGAGTTQYRDAVKAARAAKRPTGPSQGPEDD
jgi:hypothetical protein